MAFLSLSICTPPHLPMATGAASFCSSGPTSTPGQMASRQPHGVASALPPPSFPHQRRRLQVVRMAPEEEKMTRRSPLDFPIEWERPKPGRRPDIFPQFSPMKTPLPPPLPADPPEEDEEDEEEKKEEEEEDPEREEDPNKPEQ